MSIQDLEETKAAFLDICILGGEGMKEADALHIGLFMEYTISLLKDLIQEQQNIYKQLAKKEDAIDVNDIKEVKNING
ncbi:unnamed protein product [marine sediment metagenome]|uniref:Uncharacterized protein n=1 Tax=marine sediment metagenome TaxID=412755 RepID=X1B422_9ZZZZ